MRAGAPPITHCPWRSRVCAHQASQAAHLAQLTPVEKKACAALYRFHESYEKGIGMVELYYEVLTYCSRNDCLGEQLIDSGSKIHMKLLNYESE